MPHRQGTQALSNPMLGVYFGIFAACLATGVVLLLIFEQLGVTEASLKTAMVGISIVLFATIGAGAYTNRAREFLFAGRRVPAFYNGTALAIVSLGAAGITGLSGALFLAGFDMLCIGVGIVAGLTVSVMLVAPYLRKFGAPTIPSFLGQRFESGSLRLLAATVCVLPLMLLAIAEIKIGMMSVMWLLAVPPEVACGLVVLVLAITILPGGVRSLSWAGAAQALAVLIAILLPAAIAAVIETNLPFGQFSHGPIIRAVARLEAAQDVPVPVASLMALELPGAGLQPIVGRFATTFGSVGPLTYMLMTLSVLMGVVGSPAILSRAVTTPSVYDTRKSIGWAVALVGILLLTFSGVAAFERDVLISSFVGQATAAPPAPLQRLIDLGLAALDGRGARLTTSTILFDRDGVLVALPVIMGMPLAVVNLVAAGVMAAALTGAATCLMQLGVMVGDDVAAGPASWTTSDRKRLIACRLSVIGVIAVAGMGAVAAHGDPFLLMLYAIAISGSTIFPVLVLSVWWKRLTTGGAIACLVTGLFTALAVLLVDLTSLGLPGLIAPVIAVPAALIAAGIGSYLTPAPGRHILELVRDLRIPGGEAIYDREMRQARQRGQRTR
ncbi:MAG: sodium:solute symporter [Hyphomicrobiaceae bacterium]